MPTTSAHHRSAQAESQNVATNGPKALGLLHVNRHACHAFLVTILTFGLPEFHASRATKVRDSASTIGKCT